MNRYKPTPLERFINNHYRQHRLLSPDDMCIERIAAAFGIELVYYDGPSLADWDDRPGGHRAIFLDKRLPEPEQRAQFFHELAHPLRHCGRQHMLPEPFVELQEFQATHFQLAAAMPVFMMQEILDVPPANLGKILAAEFRLPLTLVMRRLEQIHARIIDSESLNRTKRFQLPPGIDITKPHVMQAIIDLRAIQRRKRGELV